MIAEQVTEFISAWLKVLFHNDVMLLASMALATYAVYDHWGRWAACLTAASMLFLIAIAGGKKK